MVASRAGRRGPSRDISCLDAVGDLKLANGRARVARHGYGPARTFQSGPSPVKVTRAKICDREAARDARESGPARHPAAVAQRTRSLDAILPVRHLRCISTGEHAASVPIRRHGQMLRLYREGDATPLIAEGDTRQLLRTRQLCPGSPISFLHVDH